MRTVSGLARAVQAGVRTSMAARRPPPAPVASVLPLAAGRRPLITDRVGPQRRGGAVLDQVDGTTCGSAVLVALAAWADPAESRRLDGPDGPDGQAVSGIQRGSTVPVAGVKAGFGARYDARQKQVHQQSTRFWPQALGTSPWGMVAWLRRHVPAAGPYRVRLVDDHAPADVASLVDAVGAALRSGRPVPLLIGTFVPRHYVMALGFQGAEWKVYEPTSGQVRAVDPALVGRRALGRLLGFDQLHAALLPA